LFDDTFLAMAKWAEEKACSRLFLNDHFVLDGLWQGFRGSNRGQQTDFLSILLQLLKVMYA
jgi:hypothetical protein